MTTIVNKEAGLADFQNDSFSTVEILAGDTPAQVSDYGLLQAADVAAGIPAWTPVFVDPLTRAVTIAVSDTTEANALTAVTIRPGTPAGSSVPVWKAGNYNIQAINWPVSFDSAAKKSAAFAAKTGAQIIVTTPYYG